MPDTTPNPDKGGSYSRDPDTGTLQPLAQPEEAQPALRRHADDEAGPAADTSADATLATAPSPQPEV